VPAARHPLSSRPWSPRAILFSLAAFGVVGGFGVTQYVHQYILYRGFGPPKPTVPLAEQGTIVTLPVRSAALDGATETSLVYLPAGYATSTQRYPVVYLLHGTPGDPRTAYVNSLHVAPRLDALVAARQAKPMIVVMPTGSTGTYQRATEWANGARPGEAWFTYLTRDVVRAVDSHFRTIPSRAARGIAGYSSGADGALNAAILKPGEFGVAEGWSGDYYQNPATVGRLPGLQHRFSAVLMATRAAPRMAAAGTQVWLYAGQDDFRALPNTLTVFHDLQRSGVKVSLQVTTGGHAWMLWSAELDPALRYFSQHLART
jgi:enterochelin esterase-like enzyme